MRSSPPFSITFAGEALRSLCRDLDERRIAPVRGGPWNTQSLRRILRSGRISGQRDHHGELVADAEWPAIISPAQTARIRALLDDPDRRTNRSARRYLLVRLLRCGLCGATLVSRPRSGGRRASCFLASFVVRPGRRGYNRFDPSRFHPVWRV
jgi:hypothetical protein